MRKIQCINQDWLFEGKNGGEQIDLPYTWNGIDGQDGGGDYFRGAFNFVKKFAKPEFGNDEQVYGRIQRIKLVGGSFNQRRKGNADACQII